MKQEPHTLRRAAGLLLAATALPHTALLAQETQPVAPTAVAPVVVAPPAPVVTAPAPVAAQPAPAPVPTMEPIIYKGPPPEETPAAPEPTSTPAPAATNTPASLGQTYVVEAGDIPVSIAAKFGITVEALLAANPDIDPRGLQVGQVLIIPAPVPTPTGG